MKDALLVLAPPLSIVPAAIAAAIAMRYIASAAIDGMTRQPEISNQLFTSMLIGMALVEALVIYCLVVALILANKVT
ncbi:MAG: ATP synthase F0 subunit C [Actinomycetota bacterium]